MAVVPVRAVLIVSFNIFRVLCKKYGLYLIIGLTIILFQGYSGYYVLRLGSDEKPVERDYSHALPSEDVSMWFSVTNYTREYCYNLMFNPEPPMTCIHIVLCILTSYILVELYIKSINVYSRKLYLPGIVCY